MTKNIRQVFCLLDLQDRRQIFVLLGVMFAAAFFETFGVVSVIPFLALVANPNAIENYGVLSDIYRALQFQSAQSFVFAAGAVTVAALALSNLVNALSTWLTFRAVHLQEHRLSAKLLESYVAKPYEFFLTRNPSELIKNTLSEVSLVVHGVMLPLLQITVRVLVALFLIILLVAIEPLVAIVVVAVLGGAYGAMYLSSRYLLSRTGVARAKANSIRFKTASQLLGGIREIKLYDRSKFFLTNYRSASRQFSSAGIMALSVSHLPRYAMEIITFGGIISIVLFLLKTHGDLEQVLPLIGLYALAGYRLLPAFQQIFVALATLRVNTVSLDNVSRELEEIGVPEKSSIRDGSSIPRMSRGLELKNISFRYWTSEEPALVDINIIIPACSSVALVGKTGSGKSTLLDVITGLLSPQSGELWVDGVRLESNDMLSWQKHFGYVPQQVYLTDDTIARNIALGLHDEDIDMQRVQEVAAAARLDEFLHLLPAGYQTVVGDRGVRLSGGQRQRVGIARALYADPEILVFDEATAALDSVTEASVMQAIEDLSGKKTLIVVSHRLTTIRNCDNIFLIGHGRLEASGSYSALMETSPTFCSMAMEPVAKEVDMLRRNDIRRTSG